MTKGRVAIGLAVIGLLLVLWLVLAGRGSSDDSAATNPAATERSGPSEAELIAANREPPPPPAPPGPPALTPAWLAGTWAPAENNPTGDPNAPCETDVVVTFFADGRYEEGEGSSGRFRIEGDRVTFFNHVIREMGSDEEDLSEFDRETVQRIVPVSQNEMRVSGDPMRRCSIG